MPELRSQLPIARSAAGLAAAAEFERELLLGAPKADVAMGTFDRLAEDCHARP